MQTGPGDTPPRPSAGADATSRCLPDVPAVGRRLQSWQALSVLLLLGWTVSAADRSLTGPIVTWMIDHGVGFLARAHHPNALGGLIGGLFFAGYMLTQFPGGYVGDRFGHRTVIVVSLLWAGVATLLTGFFGGLVVFIVLRVITGLGEGAFFSNDRTLLTAATPERYRSLAMGIAITGLAIGITVATVFTPQFIDAGKAVLEGADAWRMGFWILGAATLLVAAILAVSFREHLSLPAIGHATLRLAGYSAVSLGLIMAVYVIGDKAGLSNLWIAVLEVALAVGLVLFVLARKGTELGPVLKNIDLSLIYVANIAILWNLWFFSFWSVSIVQGAAHSSFENSALTAAFNAGAGIVGFPAGGLLSDVTVRRGWRRKTVMLACTGIQAVLTVVFAWYLAAARHPSLWLMGLLLFAASLFFNALQPVGHALTAEIAAPELRGSAFGMENLIGETGAVLAPAIGGVLRDSTGGWTAAVWLDAAIVIAGFCVLTPVRAHRASRSAPGSGTTLTTGAA